MCVCVCVPYKTRSIEETRQSSIVRFVKRAKTEWDILSVLTESSMQPPQPASFTSNSFILPSRNRE